MSWTVVGLIVTVLMGGFIAYNGDIIGRRYGKRRATLLGLRPRHTAVLVTTVTGVLISALTVGIIFLVTPPVRRVILEGERAIRAGARLQSENARLHAQVVMTREELSLLQESQARLEARYVARQRELLREIQESAGRLDRERARLDEARRLAGRAEAAKRVEMQRSRELARRNAGLERRNAELTTFNDDMGARNVELTRINGDLARANVDLVARNEDALRQSTVLEARNAELLQGNETLSRNKDVLLAVNRSLIDENGALQSEKQNMLAERDRLDMEMRGVFADVMELARALRSRRVIAHAGEDLARDTLPAGSSPDMVRERIGALLHKSHLVALERGAAAGERARAVEIQPKRFVTVSDAGATVSPVVSELDRTEALVSRLAWSPEPVCLVTVAVANAVEREPVSVDIQPFPDRLVYRKGQVLGTRRLETERTPTEVFDAIVSFLRSVGQSAMSRGMIPRLDASTGEPQVGALAAGEIAGLMERVRGAGRRVQLSAIAATDIYASEPLRLEFGVRPVL